MNATCKRLLSWLVVVTMVLSMVPVFDLSNFAVTTKAAENPGKTIIDEAKTLGEFDAPTEGNTITKKCPVCGTDQEWTALSGTGLTALTFTKADSAIVRFHYYLSDNATFSGSAMTTGGGNNHYVCLNLNGKTLTTGAVAITTNYGNIFNIMDTVGTGVLAGKSAGASAAAINVQNPNAKVNIYGGTIKRATGSNAYSSVAYIQGLGGQINLYDGTIDGTGINNTSYPTVAVLTANAGRTGTFNVYGGEIIGGTTTGDGNIQVKDNAAFNMHGGTVKDGVARGGGNFNVSGTGVLNVHGGTISGGTANKSTNITVSGGNIILTSGGSLNMDGGVICGGTTTAHGGNIQIRRDQVGHIDITGGKIYGGTAGNGNGHNIYAYSTTTGSTLNIGGTAEIAGDIYAGAGVTTTLSGTPKIKTSGLTDAEGNPVVAKNGGLTVGATIIASGVTGGEIQVTAALNKVLTDTFENAATVAQYFSNTDATLDVGANDANKLVVIEYVDEPDEPQVGVFDPENCGGLAYCEACGEAAGPQEWEAISGTDLAAYAYANNTQAVHYHYYLSGAASFSGSAFTFSGNNNVVCLNLNGQAMTTGNRAFVVTYGNTLNVMDTNGGSVTGTYAGQNAAVFYMSNPNAKINVYGGTFKRASTSHIASSVVRIENLGGKFTMYGGTIDATGVTGNNAQPGVYMAAADTRTATFDMRGGNIIGAATTGDGGAVYVTARTTFNLYNGTISGGSGRAGGNIMVYTGALNIYGGTISGGKSTNNNAYVTGGNIALRDGGSLYMEGGVVCNGEAVQNGGNIALWTSVNTAEIVGGKIYGGVAGTSGANIFNNGTAGSALTIGGTAEIAGDIATNHTTTNTLSGSPKILTSGLTDAAGAAVTGTKGYEVKGNTNIVIDELTANAQIQVTGAAGAAFTAASTNASAVAGCFSTTTDGQVVEVNDDTQLEIVEDVPQIGVFEPWEYEGMAYCPVCNNTLVEWTAIDSEFVGGTLISENNAGAHDHVYLAEDISGDVAVGGYFLDTGNNNRICLNLNGKTLNVTNGRAFMRNFCYAYWNVMDTEGGAVVSGNGVFRLDSNSVRTVDVYGGTFKTNSGDSIVYIGGNGGTFNLHDGTLDATGAAAGAFGLQGKVATNATANFNMYGGEIIGNGEIAGRVGSVLQANASTTFMGCATFTMTAGTISGGYVQVRNDNTATISGGSIEYLTTYDGAWEEDSDDNAAADYSGVTTVTLTGAPKIAQMNIGENVVVNIDGLTAGAEIAISGKTGEALMNANADETVMAGITSFAPEKYVSNEEGVVYLRLYAVAVVNAEGKTFYKTVDEAVANIGNGYIELHADELTVTISGETYIDANGYAVTVNGEGTLYAMDSANDDYVGYGSWTVNGPEVATDVINPVNGNRYIVILNEEGGNTYSAHRVEMYLTHISLRTSQAGLYYKAQYKCDATLAERVMAYGIVFSATAGEVHQDNFDKDVNVYSIVEEGFTPDENHAVNGTSVEVFGIFKNEGRTNDENVTAGEAQVHATPYINVDCDGNGVSDNDPYVIGNVKNEVYLENADGVVYAAMSLYDVLKSINDDWDYYAPENQNGRDVQGEVQDFYNDWADYGMSEWAADLANISGYTA